MFAIDSFTNCGICSTPYDTASGSSMSFAKANVR